MIADLTLLPQSSISKKHGFLYFVIYSGLNHFICLGDGQPGGTTSLSKYKESPAVSKSFNGPNSLSQNFFSLLNFNSSKIYSHFFKADNSFFKIVRLLVVK